MHPEHRFYDYGARLALSEDQTSSSSSTSTSPSSHIEPDRIPVAYFPNPDEETTEEVKEQEPGNASESDTADDQEGWTLDTISDRPLFPLDEDEEDLLRNFKSVSVLNPNLETNVELLRDLLDRSRQGHAQPS